LSEKVAIPKANPTWFAFCRWLVKVLIFKRTGRLITKGENNIPKTGAAIVAPVHVSHLDPPAVACACHRQMRFMAKEELFKNKFASWLISSLGAYKVRRGESDSESIRISIQMLSQGEALVVFPEGTRGDGKELQELSRGVAMLAKKTNAPVLPVGIVGTHTKLPASASKIGRGDVTVIYGTPFTYAEVAKGSNEKENRELFSQYLADRILELCNSEGMGLKGLPDQKRTM
jgi:1-acyl-sn-glycerol-3-phosphate acyltransferase